ncbi:MAG TPA: class I SAM-dependent methyltransferase [Thermoanaerobaculia bacterium]|nr:class I SAM-dependent methyltransferase [Thermoanaerobaculia bacterium]
MPQAALAPPRPAVSALLAEWGRSPDDPRLEVDARDEMLGFLRELHGGDEEQALAAYYRSGAAIAAVYLQVLRWRFGKASAVPSLLDFASGYGRVTRFLLDAVPARALTAADVLPGAVAFQRRTFGVQAAASATRPEELELPGPFAAILVTSLFTHLPDARFRSWLAALLARLAPGGVLAFSTHDLALLPPEQRTARGLVFQPHSEIADLAVEDYGSTWVDESFVRDALAATGRRVAARRFTRALLNHQDLWLVVDEVDGADAFAGLQLQSEPEVVVEECELASGSLALAGWAHARQGTVARVEASLDGVRLGAAVVDQPRADVAAVLGPGAERSGWGLRLALPPSFSPVDSVLLLRAVDRAGHAHPVWVGRPLVLALQSRALQAREARAALHVARRELAEHRAWAAHEIEGLRATVAAMRASRFWKLRDAWFTVKRALRLTDES